jgi:hypothetical protein
MFFGTSMRIVVNACNDVNAQSDMDPWSNVEERRFSAALGIPFSAGFSPGGTCK